MKITKNTRGFSIIEIILYVGILWIILTVITNFSLESLEERGQQKSKQAVKQDVDFVLDKITHEIENSIQINTFESVWGKLVLNKTIDKSITFSLSGSSVYLEETWEEPERISGKNTEITNIDFTTNDKINQVQIKLHAKSNNENLPVPYEEDFQISVVSKSMDSDNDGCLDIVDQFPFDEFCCTDTDGDGTCDKKDNCPLLNAPQRNDDWDDEGFSCDGGVDQGDDDDGGNGGGGSCVQGKKLAIWIDRNNNGNVDEGEPRLGNITTYSGDLTAAENYNYFSYSAHPINGPAPDPYESQVFFYEGSDGLSLNFFHNIDSDDHSEGSADNEVDWWIKTSWNELKDEILLSDDKRELTQYHVDNDNKEKKYRGKFHYWYNTDGGSIGPFEGEDFKIHVSVEESGDLTNAAFYSANDQMISLVDEGEISSFIITYEEYENCTTEEIYSITVKNVAERSSVDAYVLDDNGETVEQFADLDSSGQITKEYPNGTKIKLVTQDYDGADETHYFAGWYEEYALKQYSSGSLIFNIEDVADSGHKASSWTPWDRASDEWGGGGGGEIDYCALEASNWVDDESNIIIGGTWEGIGSVDSCIYSCNYRHEFWQTICQKFECFYTGNQYGFETDKDNDEYAGVGQVFSMESENMYWKKIFKLDVADAALSKIDRFKFSLNYCHGWSRLSTWWLKGRCSRKGYHINGVFDGDQTVEIFNYTTNSWDVVNKLKTHSQNNKEIYAEFDYSKSLRNYINSNKEVAARIKFKASGAHWGHRQRWYFLAPARYLFLDYFNLETHVQALSFCWDGKKELDEQCDDGSHCSDGTDCTAFGDCKCVGIGDGKCKPRNYIGNNCSSECLNENAVCGNGIKEENEECDDNNTEDNDGCDSSCRIETCGDGNLDEPMEECDPGPRCSDGKTCTYNGECDENVGDGLCRMRDGDDDNCSQSCLIEACGNNRIEASEQCDDGNKEPGDGCSEICMNEVCGNDIHDIEFGEECDDGNNDDDDNCSNTCKEQKCGDGFKNRTVEECDNGSQCWDEAQTACITNEDCLGIGDGECKPRNGDGCDENCFEEIAVCGNGKIEMNEECDDSNLNGGDGCSHTCMEEYTAEYNFTGSGHQAHLVFATQEPHKKDLDDFKNFVPQDNYPANVAYQVEFNQWDELLEQTLGTSYQKIAEHDYSWFFAKSLAPWFAYFEIIPQAHAYTHHGFVIPDGNKHLSHKFSFQIQDSEYHPDEISPQRIQYAQFTWKGLARRTWENRWEKRYTYLYVWKNNDWKKLDTTKWWSLQSYNKTLTFKINNDIEDYIDNEGKIHFMVESNEKGYDILATDYAGLEIKAYGYREDIE